jgi:cytochrome P450
LRSAGELVLCLVGSANSDPAYWSHPDTFDVGRDIRAAARHRTFGLGATSCLGAAMSRHALGHMLAALIAEGPPAGARARRGSLSRVHDPRLHRAARPRDPGEEP